MIYSSSFLLIFYIILATVTSTTNDDELEKNCANMKATRKRRNISDENVSCPINKRISKLDRSTTPVECTVHIKTEEDESTNRNNNQNENETNNLRLIVSRQTFCLYIYIQSADAFESIISWTFNETDDVKLITQIRFQKPNLIRLKIVIYDLIITYDNLSSCIDKPNYVNELYIEQQLSESSQLEVYHTIFTVLLLNIQLHPGLRFLKIANTVINEELSTCISNAPLKSIFFSNCLFRITDGSSTSIFKSEIALRFNNNYESICFVRCKAEASAEKNEISDGTTTCKTIGVYIGRCINLKSLSIKISDDIIVYHNSANLSNLKKFSYHGDIMYLWLYSNLLVHAQLEHLFIAASGSKVYCGIELLRLINTQNLQQLVLRDYNMNAMIWNLYDIIKLKLDALVTLKIKTLFYGTYDIPNNDLHLIMRAMPNLRLLEIECSSIGSNLVEWIRNLKLLRALHLTMYYSPDSVEFFDLNGDLGKSLEQLFVNYEININELIKLVRTLKNLKVLNIGEHTINSIMYSYSIMNWSVSETTFEDPFELNSCDESMVASNITILHLCWSDDWDRLKIFLSYSEIRIFANIKKLFVQCGMDDNSSILPPTGYTICTRHWETIAELILCMYSQFNFLEKFIIAINCENVPVKYVYDFEIYFQNRDELGKFKCEWLCKNGNEIISWIWSK